MGKQQQQQQLHSNVPGAAGTGKSGMRGVGGGRAHAPAMPPSSDEYDYSNFSLYPRGNEGCILVNTVTDDSRSLQSWISTKVDFPNQVRTQNPTSPLLSPYVLAIIPFSFWHRTVNA